MIAQRRLALLAASRRPLFCAAAPIASATGALFRRPQSPVSLLRSSTSRRWESTVIDASSTTAQSDSSAVSSDSSADTSGHISVETNEAILFFDNIFPLRLSGLLLRSWKTDQDLSDLLNRFETSSLGILDPIRLVKTAIPNDLPIKVTEILPRLKDGGAYVKFRHDANLDPAEIEATLIKQLRERPLKPWFSPFRGVSARLVQGTPWLEDLSRYPTSLVRVEFTPPSSGVAPEELPEEVLYTLFRKYGKIADIIPQPADSKVVPRYAQVGFPLIRDAIMARNCMHGFIVNEALGGGAGGTKLRMSFEKRVKPHSLWNWLTNHPRIVIPVLAALIAGLSVIVFDPIREFFVKVHIQHSLKLTESKVYKWFRKQTGNFSLSNKKKEDDGLHTVWNHRRDLIEEVKGWLQESTNTFIVVTGPRGSGKEEMVLKQSLEGRKNVLKIDCRPIVEARGEAGLIKRLATAVGYRPVFSWANSMSSLVDLAVQSTTGVKAGFSETLESQLNKILQTTSSALQDVAVSSRTKKDSDANLSADAYLEAHPERRPVVVIENFFHKSEEQALVYDKIAEWAAGIVQNNVAHVIFLTTDSASSKPLAKAMPDRVLRSVSLGDLAPNVAKNFVVDRVKGQIADEQRAEEGDERKPIQGPNLGELDSCIATLGGRLTDLEFLSRRLRTGQSPKQAVNEIVTESATDIVRMFLLNKSSENESRKWTAEQAWHLIKALAENPSLRYNQIVLSGPFSASTDADAALDGLAGAELITIKTYQGRPQSITAGRPLHQAAFGVLLSDKVLRAKMDLGTLTVLSKVEAKNIDKYEAELSLLGNLPRQTTETGHRVNFLLGKLEASQLKIAKWDSEMDNLKRVLNEEY